MILREVWDMKSLLSWTQNNSQIETGSHFNSLTVTQSKFIDNTYTMQFYWKRDMNAASRKNTLAIQLKKLF